MLTQADFQRALEYVFFNEGGFSNHKDDKGGPTKYGITLSTLAQWRKNSALVLSDVVDLSRAEAGEIYLQLYWLPLGCHKLKSIAVATALFDAGVLFGVHGASSALQAAVGVRADGIVGPVTLFEVNQREPAVVVASFQLELFERVAGIIKKRPQNAVFEHGWCNRIHRMQTLVASA